MKHERHRNNQRQQNERGHRDHHGGRTQSYRNDQNVFNDSPKHPPIKYWKKDKPFIKKTTSLGLLPLKLEATIERPKFVTGEKGFHRLTVTITVGDYHIRLPTKAILTLIAWLENDKQALLDAIEEVHKRNEEHNANLKTNPMKKWNPQQEKSQKQRPRRRRQVIVTKNNKNGPPRGSRSKTNRRQSNNRGNFNKQQSDNRGNFNQRRQEKRGPNRDRRR